MLKAQYKHMYLDKTQENKLAVSIDYTDFDDIDKSVMLAHATPLKDMF